MHGMASMPPLLQQQQQQQQQYQLDMQRFYQQISQNPQFNLHLKKQPSLPPPVASFQQLVHKLLRKLKPGSIVDRQEFFQQCILLSRYIDNMVAKRLSPASTNGLLQLLKQICTQKDDPEVGSAVAVLLLSFKSGVQSGWFKGADIREFSRILNSLLENYRGALKNSETNFVEGSEDTSVSEIISTILPRFYPRLKVNTVIHSTEAKPGYEVLLHDLFLNKICSPDERVRLFVVRKDRLENSTCLITPHQVNFLINGHPVEKRNTMQLDSGPQMPTDITKLLKFGVNIMQIIGEFQGTCAIIVAYSATVPFCSKSVKLPIFDAPLQHPDEEVIEGSSRVSLRCPISRTRIITPVKGHRCMHLQCFDYDNYIEINSTRPSWRCPYCNLHVNCPDIRFDQQMAKVLQEVKEDVFEVMVENNGKFSPCTFEITATGAQKEGNCSNKIIDISDDDDNGERTNKLPKDVETWAFSSPAVGSGFLGDGCQEDRKPIIQHNTPAMSSIPTPLPSNMPIRSDTTAMSSIAATLHSRMPVRTSTVSMPNVTQHEMSPQVTSQNFAGIRTAASENVAAQSSGRARTSEMRAEQRLDAARGLENSVRNNNRGGVFIGTGGLYRGTQAGTQAGNEPGAIPATTRQEINMQLHERLNQNRVPIAIQALPAPGHFAGANSRYRGAVARGGNYASNSQQVPARVQQAGRGESVASQMLPPHANTNMQVPSPSAYHQQQLGLLPQGLSQSFHSQYDRQFQQQHQRHHISSVPPNGVPLQRGQGPVNSVRSSGGLPQLQSGWPSMPANHPGGPELGVHNRASPSSMSSSVLEQTRRSVVRMRGSIPPGSNLNMSTGASINATRVPFVSNMNTHFSPGGLNGNIGVDASIDMAALLSRGANPNIDTGANMDASVPGLSSGGVVNNPLSCHSADRLSNGATM